MFKTTLNVDEISDIDRHRRKTLNDLACDLIKECVEWRIMGFSANLFVGFDSNLIHAFLRLGFTVTRNQRRRAINSQPRRRCNHHDCRSNRNENKYKLQCAVCLNTFCNQHCTLVKNIVCSRCTLE